MDFCDNCFNLLELKEHRVDKTFSLVLHCYECNTSKPCSNYCVYNKVYKENETTKIGDSLINKYKIKDKTLPCKVSKCTKCNAKNKNPYMVKYVNNSFNIYFICVSCEETFKK